MSEAFNFLHWRIGTVRRWLVRVRVADLPPHRSKTIRRWVSISDGPRVQATIEGKNVPLTFTPLSGERSVRRCLREAVHPIACRLDLMERNDIAEGALEILQTPLPVTLEGPVLIHLPPSADARALEAQLMLPSGSGPLLVAQTELLLARRGPSGATQVTLLANDRRRLEASLMGPPGHQFLSVHTIHEPTSRPEAPDARFVAFSGPLRVVTTLPPPGAGTDLSPLLPPPHDLLEAWIEYEGLDRSRERSTLERRTSCPLEFQLMGQLKGDTAFEIHIVNGTAALASWPSSDSRANSARMDGEVRVTDLTGAGSQPASARLERLEDRPNFGVVAVLRFDNQSRTPPARGRLDAVESRGAETQRKRRDDVLDELRSGDFANPRLLDLLLSPERAPRATTPRGGLYKTSSGRTLEDRQREAVLKASQQPSILLVQGPPGTGKTEVVAAIVEELLHRHRHRVGSSDREEGRCRILLAGAQNEATSNMIARVGKGVTVAVWLSDKTSPERGGLERRGREVAGAVRELLENDTIFRAYSALRTLASDLEAAALQCAGRPAKALLIEVERLASSSLTQRLTPQLRSDLTDLAARAADAREAKQRALEPPGRPADVWSPAFAVAAQADGAPVDIDRAQVLSGRIKVLTALLEDVASGTDEQMEVAFQWSSLGRRLDRDVARGAMSVGTQEAFERLAAQTRELGPPDSTPSDPPPLDPSESLGREAKTWLVLAQRAIALQLAELEKTEAAILEEWMRTLEDSPAIYNAMVDRHAPVAAATCQRSKRTAGDSADKFFDVVIVDEAARAGLDILIPMTLGRSIILVGDHLQLPPHIDTELEHEMEQGTLERINIRQESLFRWLRGRLPAENFVALDRQFRMHENIGGLVSRLFYEPENVALTHHWTGPLASARRPRFGLANDEPLVWLDTSDRPDAANCFEENLYEVDLVVRLLQQVDRAEVERRQREDSRAKIVGVLSFYSRQAELISRRIELDPVLREFVEISTVHGVQGREFPLVILATTKSNDRGSVGVVADPHAVNVALSRAQRQLVIVGDSRTLAPLDRNRGSPPFRKAFQLLRDPVSNVRGRIIYSAEVMS